MENQKIQKVSIKKSRVVAKAVICLIVFVVFGIATFSYWTGQEVKSACHESKLTYDGDCVERLIQLIEDDKGIIEEKRRAVKALGKLDDNRALPTLQKYHEMYSIDECDKGKLCKFELEEAINAIKRAPPFTAIFWKDELDLLEKE